MSSIPFLSSARSICRTQSVVQIADVEVFFGQRTNFRGEACLQLKTILMPMYEAHDIFEFLSISAENDLESSN
jgi:hypothetical protein